MQKIIFYFLPILFSILLFSCSKDYEEISDSEFVNTVLPKVEVKNIEVVNHEIVLIYTNEAKPYKIKFGSKDSMQTFLNTLQSKDGSLNIIYTAESNTPFYLYIFTLIPLIFPLLILAHIPLIWIALRRIIKSEADNMEKLIYTIISVFVPFFGPIIYLTTKKS